MAESTEEWLAQTPWDGADKQEHGEAVVPSAQAQACAECPHSDAEQAAEEIA
jgi:hypothetical protein